MPRCVNKIVALLSHKSMKTFKSTISESCHCQIVAIEEQLSFFTVAFSKISKAMYKQSLL